MTQKSRIPLTLIRPVVGPKTYHGKFLDHTMVSVTTLSDAADVQTSRGQYHINKNAKGIYAGMCGTAHVEITLHEFGGTLLYWF